MMEVGGMCREYCILYRNYIHAKFDFVMSADNIGRGNYKFSPKFEI